MDLLTAIESKPLSEIQEIVLQKGLPIDFSWLDYDALNRALTYKRNDVAKWLIEQHICRVNKISDSNESILDSTPLHNAVKLGDMEIVEMLLKNEASIVAIDSDDNTALHISFLYRYDKITDLLLDYIVHNSDYANKKNNQGLSHLHIASSRNKVKAIEGLLKAEANVGEIVKADSPSSWAGYSALHFALEFRSLEAAKVLLAAGSQLKDDENNIEQSSLQLLNVHLHEFMIMSDHLHKNVFPNFHTACLKESISVVKKFIDAGANINEAIKWGESLCDHYSPLHFAIESPYDRKEKIELLLNHGATVEGGYLLKQNHMTALHLAFYKENYINNLDSTTVDCLYKAVRNKEKNFEDENELSYFHIAVTRNDFVAVKNYLDNGANVDQAVLQNDRGFSGYSALLFAVHYQLVDMAKFLIGHEANVNAGEAGKHQTPLFKAFQMKNIELIVLLFKSGAQLNNAADSLGNTLLHYAAELGNDTIVRYLIDSGIYDVNCQNNLGKNPVFVSIEVDTPCYKVVEILLNKGADIFKEDYYGDYAMATANSIEWLIPDMERLRIFNRFLDEEPDLMHFDILEEVKESVIEMFLRTGVDLFKSYNNGETLIHLLAKNSNPGVIEHLRGHDFNVDARDNQGRTPLWYATNNGIANTMEFFLDQGADIEAADYLRHQTPLYIAMDMTADMLEDYQECVQILLERDANAQVEIAGNANPTILDVVWSNQNFRLSELALAHLAFQEANGTAITELIRHKINSREQFKSYYEFCQQKLSDVICNSVTLFDVLAASERKLESYLRKKVIASKLKTYQSVDYFKTVLSKRLPGRIAMIELKKTAEPVVCELMMIDHDSYPGIAEETVGYLEKQDLENLISM